MSTLPGLRTVATGLGLVYAGLCLLVVSIVLPYLAGYLAATIPVLSLGGVLLTAAALVALGVLLDVAGRLCCLATPRQTGARAVIYASVVFDLVALSVAAVSLYDGLTLLGILNLSQPVSLPEVVVNLEGPLSLTAQVLFLLFLRQLALFVGAPRLASRAVLVLGLGLAVDLLLFLNSLDAAALAGLQTAGPWVFVLALLAFLGLGAGLLILYGNLLTHLRKAVLQYAEGGVAAQPASLVSAAPRLGAFVRGAYERLRALAPHFNREGNEEAFTVLSSLEPPVLPEAVANLTVERPHGPSGEVAFSSDKALNLAVAEANLLERAADVLGGAGSFDLVDRLSTDAVRVKNAVIVRSEAP